jgi:NADH-quinone oxidoreductase subunit N
MQHFLPLVPELLVVVAGALLAARGRLAPGTRRWVPAAAFVIVLAALGLELWLGASLVLFARGAYVQDRFALLGKAVLLVALLLVIATSGWEGERGQRGLAPATLAALAGMVAVSATSLPLLWIAVVVAAGAGLLAGSQRIAEHRTLLWTAAGGAACAGVGMLAAGLIGHSWTFTGLRDAITGPSGPGLTVVAIVAATGVLAPAAMLPLRAIGGEEEPAVQESVLGALVGVTCVLAEAKLLAGLFGAGPGWGPYLAVVAAGATLACGLAALATGSLRALAAWLVTGQLAWSVAALAAHDRMGSAAAVYLLAALVLAAAPVPLLASGLGGHRAGLGGAAARQPWRWLALSLALLSLVGMPPLAGFFGLFPVAMELLRAQLAWVLAAGLLGVGVGLWAVVRVLITAWLEPEQDERRATALGLPVTAALAVVLVLAYGVAAQPIHGLAVQSAEALGLLR